MASKQGEYTFIKAIHEATTEELVEFLFTSTTLKSTKNGKSTSLIIKKAKTTIPPHIVAEAISTYRGTGLRWSKPSTPAEMKYVEQYVLAKYPEYSNALAKGNCRPDLNDLCIKQKHATPLDVEKRKTPKGVYRTTLRSHFDHLEKTRLDPSRLQDIIAKKSSYEGSFVSVSKIQAQKKVLEQCGLSDEEYLVLFTSSSKETMMLVGQSYPFFKGVYYMTFIDQESDHIPEFACIKDARVIVGPTAWLDLRIRGSQLSQQLRRKSHHSPKGLFSYPVKVNGICSSMHWVSEAHKNSWHVLLDATSMVIGDGKLDLALHRPDFVLCNPENARNDITCLLVRRKSFETTTL